MVVTWEAVMSGCRVLWCVAAVAIPISEDTAPMAPANVAASFTFHRSEMNTVPNPSSSPRRTSSIRSRGEVAAPASV